MKVKLWQIWEWKGPNCPGMYLLTKEPMHFDKVWTVFRLEDGRITSADMNREDENDEDWEHIT